MLDQERFAVTVLWGPTVNAGLYKIHSPERLFPQVSRCILFECSKDRYDLGIKSRLGSWWGSGEREVGGEICSYLQLKESAMIQALKREQGRIPGSLKSHYAVSFGQQEVRSCCAPNELIEGLLRHNAA